MQLYKPQVAPQQYGGMASNLIGQGQQAGFFNPFGSPQIMQLLRQQGVQSLGNQLHSQGVLGSIMGLDPYQQRQGALDTQRQGNAALSSQLTGAHLQQLMGNQDWFRQLFGGQLGNENQQGMAQLMAHLQQQNQPGFGDFLGGILGTGLGGILGGPIGAGIGSRIAGKH